MISCELDKKLSNFEKKDCFQNNRGHAAKDYFSLNDFYAWAACNGQNSRHHRSCGPSLMGKNIVGVLDLHARDALECQILLSEK